MKIFSNVTTRPLPVQNLRQTVDSQTGEIRFEWEPHPESHQDSYRVNIYRLSIKNILHQ